MKILFGTDITIVSEPSSDMEKVGSAQPMAR